MQHDGRGRVLDGFAPMARFAPEPPFGDQTGRFVAEDRDPSRALAFLGELGSKVTKESVNLVPVLVSLLKHAAAVVVRQCIISGTGFFCAVLEEIAFQIHNSGMIERWLEEIWSWMLKFRDALFGVIIEHGSVSARALSVKFLEIYVLLFSSEPNDMETTFTEGFVRSFNISRLVGRHPILDSGFIAFDMKRCLDFLISLLNYHGTFPGSLTIVVINCIANIARKRPVQYNRILSALLAFESDFDNMKVGGHAASVRYSLRTSFLGFLRCVHHPSMADSRDKLLWVLRAMNPGESTEQIIRQAEKISKNMERIARDSRLSKDEMSLKQLPIVGDHQTKRILPENDGSMIADEPPSKRVRYDVSVNSSSPHFANDSSLDNGKEDPVDDSSSKDFLVDSTLPAVEQMIAMIGVMIAQGEKGAAPLELLISKMQPELLADIVIVNMKHLPSSLPPLVSRLRNAPDSSQNNLGMTTNSVVGTITADTSSFHTSEVPSQQLSTSVSSTGLSAVIPDTSSLPNMVDAKRDPRRDPRRLDPRRVVAPVGSDTIVSNSDSISSSHSSFGNTQSRPVAETMVAKVDVLSVSPAEENTEPQEDPIASITDVLTSPEDSRISREDSEVVISSEVAVPSEPLASPVPLVLDMLEPTPPVVTMEEDDADMSESDLQQSPAVPGTSTSEQAYDLPVVPSYIQLSDEQMGMLGGLAILRVIEVYKQMATTDCIHVCLSLLPRLVGQIHDCDEIIAMLQKHIIMDYQRHKGHELVMHILYHLHAMMISEEEQESSFAFTLYEKFLLAVMKSLRESLPASDKAFTRLFGEVPLLPDSALEMLEDLCQTPSSDQHGKDAYDGDRVTQGLGTVWSLILGRPLVQQACLNIALKCTVHAQDEVRAKAIRLVANKLYLLSYVSENIEQFAKDKLLSLVDKGAQEDELTPQGSGEQRLDASSQETSTSGIQNSVVANMDAGPAKDAHANYVGSTPLVSLSQAQRYTSLFFALCTKKASLLQVVFDIYGKAPKAVKQSIHRHVPALVRNMGPSFSDLLHIISDPSEGSENLLMLVLQILTEEMTPSVDLIATVKHLYATKLKDATILIPLLSSLSKNEVLPIFPRLVDLPMDKLQTALARILEGSAHTGPALTPVEVLVAIHDINPERDGVPLKKIMDACTACFEQRTVFTQQVLAKSLNHLVDRTQLPLLFMRTVIQAIDAFPTLVDFVMEILSKLVSKQIWKMPKLWVGFLKCASQTQPHSFPVLLQLPVQQLEIVLSKHPNLRAPLSAHVSQPHVKSSLPRPTLASLGLVSELQQQSHPIGMSSMHTSDTSGSSIHGAALT